ncbi:Phosphotransferase enzyme family protein [Roseovarius nanhaiticus]|uniref:Phosphotransferase enzyme family protein n=1 Tax=Roseovarius nanhaiticus TaxID=573024 RepID=A0A1N7H698_9RHOB|nr:phosphotransferase [Roseovarius nanhaiticus]SEL11338.1 Phosphotransferase enzyme family protein [Roseovarius nanhaiticus]SIS20342.1 Phosphotransferase enzyme family protein [Roseovarius nanhaiticus]
MGKKSNAKRLARLIAAAEAHFGEAVIDSSAPGGESRASWRLVMPSRSVIGTLRPNFRRTHLEAFALTHIGALSDDVPQCLGVVGEIMFQSDVGGRRLNQEIVKLGRAQRADTAYQAVAAIFRIQAAARAAGLNEQMPHLGINADWIANFADGVEALAPYSQGRGMGIDRAALAEAALRPAVQFVKWDCRSGNAAMGPDDKVRWFDLEYCGVRHGAEDLAWLLGDEAWPVPPDQMEDMIVSAFDASGPHALEPYLDYLSLYTTLHVLQRFQLIIDEAQSRGWLSKTRIRSRDDVGVHPEFAAHLCRVGAHFAQRNALTAPLQRDFEEAETVFCQILSRAAGGRPDQMRVPA